MKNIQREAVMAQFEVLSWHLPGGTEKNYEKPVSIVGAPDEI
jgi:hypothetical protein